VRSGDEKLQIDKIVQKVIFNLHETFENNVRECTASPYCVKENGYGQFDLPIDIYFNGSDGEKYSLLYFLELPPINSTQPLHRLRKEKITFINPSPNLKRALIESGAQVKSTNISSSTKSHMTFSSSSSVNSSLSASQSSTPVNINNNSFLNGNVNNSGTELVKKKSSANLINGEKSTHTNLSNSNSILPLNHTSTKSALLMNNSLNDSSQFSNNGHNINSNNNNATSVKKKPSLSNRKVKKILLRL
jgi:transcription initiation factor IIF auxiliary subunit